jgi:hypothetical protein
VVQRASATGTELPAALIDNVRKQFDAIDQELAGIDEQDPVDCEAKLSALVVRAEELERLRAYVMPREEILIEGLSRLSDMSNWSVPQSVIDQLQREVMPQLRSANLVEARGALRALYEVYDYWDWWVEEHSRTMRIASRVMLGLLVAFLTGAVFLLHYGHVYSGIFCAGTSGAILSVLAKLPPVLSYGAANSYFYRIVGRVAIGIAASMIGMGLLASDLITLQLSDHLTIAKMLDGKDRLCAPDAGSSAAAAPPAMSPACTPDDPRLSRRSVLLLMAIAMLFGFSERALSTFEEKIFPSTTTMIVQTGPVQPGLDAGGGRGGQPGTAGGGGPRGPAGPADEDGADPKPAVVASADPSDRSPDT